MKEILNTLIASVLFCAPLAAQNNDAANAQHLVLGQRKSASTQMQSRLNTHPDAQWFPNAGFGLFLHLGYCAQHGGIDLSWSMIANKSWEDGELPPNEYFALADTWNPKKFKPDRILRKAKKAGFKYAVLTTKHHDGYTMWPSKYGDFGVKQKLGGRDIVREFVDACRKYGLKVGLYYSPPDWHFDAPYKNWNAKGKPIFDMDHKPVDSLPAKPEGHDRERREMAANQVRELLTEYGKIDIFFFDGGRGEISNDEVRKLQPGIVINRRNGELGDYGDSEGALPERRPEGWFECNDTCWPSRWWGYSTSDRMDSAEDVIEKLVLMRAWGANFLANVGPMGDGGIPKEALEAWKGIGKWMKHSGESVFDTQGGSFPEKADQPVTLKGDSLMYIHALPNFHKGVSVKDVTKTPKTAILLRTGEEMPFEYKNNILTVHIPAHKRTRTVDTVKIIFD